MRRVRYLIAALSLSFALPAWAGDLKDTAGEKTHEARKDLRDLKPGDKDAGDRKDDAVDTMKASGFKGRKKARHAGKKIKAKANETKEKMDK